MLQKQHSQKTQGTTTPSPELGSQSSVAVADVTVADGKVTGSVLVNYGIHAKSFPIGNMTVAAARRVLEPQLNLDPKAVAVIGGEIVSDEETRVIQDRDQMLSFVKRSSVKGA